MKRKNVLEFLKNNRREVSVVALMLVIIVSMIYSCEAYAQRWNELKPPRPRFELLLFERTSAFADSASGSNIYRWEVWHDKETGQEIVCPMGIKEASCYLTGRSWK